MSRPAITVAVATAALLTSLATPVLGQETAEPDTPQSEAQPNPQAGAVPPGADEPIQVDPSQVLATVNGTDITLGHVIVARRTLPEQFQNLPNETLLPGLVDQLVQQTLLAATLEEEPPSITLQVENETRNLRAGAALREYLSGAVSEEAVREAYDARVTELEPETEYRASHILVETEEEAQEIITELDGGADFADLARARSTGPSGPRGGDLGFFGPGMMVEPFQNAVEALEPGEVSEPVETQFGFHVIRLEETRQSEVPPFEQLAPEIAQELQREAVQERIETLTTEADVTRESLEVIDPRVLSSGVIE